MLSMTEAKRCWFTAKHSIFHFALWSRWLTTVSLCRQSLHQYWIVYITSVLYNVNSVTCVLFLHWLITASSYTKLTPLLGNERKTLTDHLQKSEHKFFYKTQLHYYSCIRSCHPKPRDGCIQPFKEQAFFFYQTICANFQFTFLSNKLTNNTGTGRMKMRHMERLKKREAKTLPLLRSPGKAIGQLGMTIKEKVK